MKKRDSTNEDKTDERTSLINGDPQDSASTVRQNSFQRRSSGYLNEATKPQRFRAIRICYFGIFVSSIVFSITATSLWPFLQRIDEMADLTFFGWIVAAFSFGQLIASPIIGYIANRTNNNKMPLVVSTILIVIANILYAYLQSIDTPGVLNRWWFMVARFIMGVGAANSTIMRSYGSAATTLKERTSVMANMSAYQGLGFILGPLFQALFAFLGYPGPIEHPWLHINIYTAPAFFSALTAAINTILFLVAFHDVRAVSVTRKSIQGNSIEEVVEVKDEERHDQLVAIICCLYMFFVAYVTFTNLEVLMAPLTIDMYAWSNEASTRNNGYLLGVLGLISVVSLIGTKLLAKRWHERTLMLAGIVICFIGYFIFLPWGDDYAKVQMPTVLSPTPVTSHTVTAPTNVTSTTRFTSSSTAPIPTTSGGSSDGGCPWDYDWCFDVPIIQLWQYYLGSVIIVIGFSICNVIAYSIFSKKLGDRPQGTMMGIFTSSGALARIIGPIIVGFLYKQWGPRVTMIFMLVVILTSVVALVFNFKRLYIPPEVLEDMDDDEENNVNTNGGDQLNSNEDDQVNSNGDDQVNSNGDDQVNSNDDTAE